MRVVTLVTLCFFALEFSYGQCGACAIGDTCTVSPPLPTVCPAITPTGMVGVPYAIDVTFWIPPSFPEPTTTLNVVLQQVTVTSISNVPIGLTFEADSPTLTYFPQEQPFGCVRVCGIPLVPSQDTIVISVLAQGTVGSIPTTQPYSLNIPVEVQPADGSNVGFSYTPDSGCAPLTVAFEPLISGPGLSSSYAWDFDNGSTYIGPDPPPQAYTTAGSYFPQLETTVTAPMLTQVVVSGVNGSWCGDLDEPSLFGNCIGQPDLYFVLRDSLGGSARSSTMNNVTSATWNGLALPLLMPPYSLSIYDADNLSDDDLLGTFALGSIEPGAYPFSVSGTSGSMTVQIQTVQTLTNTDTIVVFPAPSAQLVVDENALTLCAVDAEGLLLEWTLDGEPFLDGAGTCVPALNGSWMLVVTSALGCSDTTYMVLLDVGQDELLADGSSLMIYPVPNQGSFILNGSTGKYTGMLSMVLVDATGRVVHEAAWGQSSGSFSNAVSVPNAGPGIYSVALFCGGQPLGRRTLVIATP